MGVKRIGTVGSTYQPTRKLWQQLEKGYYLPCPDMRLRRTTSTGEVWTGFAEAMNLTAVNGGKLTVSARPWTT
jgi:hypothetical protein